MKEYSNRGGRWAREGRDYLNKYTMVSTSVCSLTATQVYRHFIAMREEILRHKWCESEKAGKDVGFEYALVDWMIKHKPKWEFEIKGPF